MNTQKLKAQASIGIKKPMEEVFEAIVNPEKMFNYFIYSSTGRLEENKIIEWNFPEFTDKFPVVGKTIRPHEYISFDWSNGQPGMLVEIHLKSSQNHSTVVKVVEHEMENTPDGVKWLAQQTEGWANFLACLKAYLEHGINLRKGAFDFMVEN